MQGTTHSTSLCSSCTNVVYCQGKVGQTTQASITPDPSECPHSVFSSFPCFFFLAFPKLYLPSLSLSLEQNKKWKKKKKQITCNTWLRDGDYCPKLKDGEWSYRALINKCRDRLRRLEKDQRGIWRKITARDHQCSAIRPNMTACRPNQLFTTAKSIELSRKDNHQQHYLEHIHSRKHKHTLSTLLAATLTLCLFWKRAHTHFPPLADT